MTPASESALAAESVNLWKLACLLASLLCLAGLIAHFGLESKAFLYLTVLTVSGFAVHYFLPLRYRLPFFLVLSFGGHRVSCSALSRRRG